MIQPKFVPLFLDECLKRGSRDNMSAMIIQFVDGTAYAQPKEYVPGPYFSDEHSVKFQEAYRADAQAAGFSMEQALQKRAELDASTSEPNTQSPSDTSRL